MEAAMKFERNDADNPTLKHEYDMYKLIKKQGASGTESTVVLCCKTN